LNFGDDIDSVNAYIDPETGEVVIEGISGEDVVVRIVLPPGSTVPSGESTLGYRVVGDGFQFGRADIGGIVVSEDGKSVSLPKEWWIGDSWSLCINDSPAGVLLDSQLLGLCVTDTSQSQVKLSCPTDEPQEFTGFPDPPGTRTYTCEGDDDFITVTGLAYSTVALFSDEDDDDVNDVSDNCPAVPNPGQEDADSDDQGDACDACPFDADNDADEDGVCGDVDNCPQIFNPNQSNNDLDDEGDECDDDDDNDGILDGDDNCPLDSNPGQEDLDGDGAGDICDKDDDNDGILDANDQCLNTGSGEVINSDGCSIADLCPCDNVWKNHGAYVKCVAHTSNDFVSDDLITEAEKDAIVSEAAESACGHKK
jgi:hypothetical protein